MFSEIYVFFKSIFLMYVQYPMVFVRILAVDVLHKTRRVVCNPKFLQNFHVIFVWSLIIFDITSYWWFTWYVYVRSEFSWSWTEICPTCAVWRFIREVQCWMLLRVQAMSLHSWNKQGI